VFEQRRQVLAVCGFELAPPRFDLTVPFAEQQWAADRLPQGAFHFSINASTYLKEWPLLNWIQLARDLLRDHAEARIVATGSSQERERDRLTQLAVAVNDPRLIVLDRGLSVAQLAATLARCRAHIGADSGVLHLAMAVGTPTVSIFRQYKGMEEWLPAGPKHHHVSVPCACAEQRNPPCQALGIAKCLETISPASVAALLQNYRAGSDCLNETG
jgi:ADP-heptose:LPS heptosyltransferase